MQNERKQKKIMFSEECRYQKEIYARIMTFDGEYPLHFHNHFELEYVIDGEAYHLFNGKRLPAGTGELCFITPEDYHGWEYTKKTTLLTIGFSEAIFPDHIKHIIWGCKGKQVQLTKATLQHIYPLMERVLEECSLDNLSYSDIYAQYLVGCILIELLRLGNTVPVEMNNDMIRRVTVWLQQHYQEPITSADAAAYTHMSVGHFCKVFKETIGRSFADYLQNLRLQQAVRLLSATDTTTTEVCFRCGFGSYPSFYRSFKKYTGISPTEYKAEREKAASR